MREVGPRLRSRRGRTPRTLASARAFLDWLLDDNYIFQGTVRTASAPTACPTASTRAPPASSPTPRSLPVVFPGLMEEVEAHLQPQPSDHRIVDIDYCNNASAIYHLEPIDDIVIREWGAGRRSCWRPRCCVGRLAKGAFTQKAGDIPLLQGEARLAPGAERGAAEVVRLPRDPRALQPLPHARAVLRERRSALKEIIDRIVYMTGDDEIAVHARKGAGYVALYVAFSRLRYSYQIEAGPAGRPWPTRSGRSPSAPRRTWAR